MKLFISGTLTELQTLFPGQIDDILSIDMYKRNQIPEEQVFVIDGAHLKAAGVLPAYIKLSPIEESDIR